MYDYGEELSMRVSVLLGIDVCGLQWESYLFLLGVL